MHGSPEVVDLNLSMIGQEKNHTGHGHRPVSFLDNNSIIIHITSHFRTLYIHKFMLTGLLGNMHRSGHFIHF